MPFPAPEAALSRARTAAPRFASCGGRVAAAPTTPSTDHTHRLPLVDLQAADIPGTLTRAGTSARSRRCNRRALQRVILRSTPHSSRRLQAAVHSPPLAREWPGTPPARSAVHS